MRKQSFVLSRRRLPDAIVRDQLPLKFLHQCLLPGVSAQEYLDELNGRVFFHVSQERLHRLLKARAYRNHTHDVITIDTRGFLEIHAEVDLAPYNTGSIHVPNMPARGPSTFVPLEDYPWEDWRRRRGAQDAVTELTVRGAATVAPAVLAVEQWRDGERIRS